MDVWEWFKFESIYEQIYNDIIAIQSKSAKVSGLRLPTVSKFITGLVLSISQILILICPFLIFGKYGSSKNEVKLVTLNLDLIYNQSITNFYNGVSARSIEKLSSFV